MNNRSSRLLKAAAPIEPPAIGDWITPQLVSNLVENWPEEIVIENVSNFQEEVNFHNQGSTPNTFQEVLIPRAINASFTFKSVPLIVNGIDIARSPESMGPINISNNLHKMILGGRLIGKVYKDKWEDAFKETIKETTANRTEAIVRDDAIFSESTLLETPIFGIEKKELKGLSFFDLIKPILMPPLETLDYKWVGFLPPDRKPYDFQNDGIKRLVENQSFLLADEMGTGKTVMATLALRLLMQQGKVRKALVLCPVTLLRVWEDHLKDWSLSELKIVRPYGPKLQRKAIWNSPAHVYITTYDTFRTDTKNGNVKLEDIDIDLLIMDEAQYIKNPSSSRHKSIRPLRAKWKWALTGTPIENSVEDVKSIFSIIHPELLKGMADKNNHQEVKAAIKPWMLRRLKKDVLKDLPPKTRQEIWLSLDGEQRREYQLVLGQIRTKLRDDYRNEDAGIRINALQAIQKLKQICNFSQATSQSCKLDAVKDLIEEVVSSNSKVLIFSQFVKEGIDKLESSLEIYGVRKMIGEMSGKSREISMLEFQNDPKISAFLISVKTGGVGITLTEASYVIHFDHWWNPAVLSQAEDRVHRVGQKKPVTIYELWVEDTIEENIYKILKDKRQIANDVIDDLATDPLEKLSVEELLHDVLGIEDIAVSAKLRVQHEFTDPSDNLSNVDELRRQLRYLSPAAFEVLVSNLFKKLGYQHVTVTGKSGDGGIDVIAENFDDVGNKIITTIQCKRYRNNVSVKEVRDLLGSVTSSGHHKGYLVTTSDFTLACRKFAAQNSSKLELIDGGKLVLELLKFGLLP